MRENPRDPYREWSYQDRCDARWDPEEEEGGCGRPCHPNQACDECAPYWQRMIREGYWDPRGKWTNKGMREMCK